MRIPTILATMLLAATLGGTSALAQDSGQTSAANPQQPAPAPKDKSKTPPADAATPDAPQKPPAKKPSTAEDNPFPEDISRKAEADAKAADAPEAPSASVPATPRQPGSSSRDGLEKFDTPDTADLQDPKRAVEDLRVGRFYLKSGDYKGAYARFKDATVYDSDNADAVFWLAEAARKLNHGPEAVQNYQVYLAAVPDGPNAKAARKALSELASTGKLESAKP
jgi:tetratricopeptide (TPR) repeat protein